MPTPSRFEILAPLPPLGGFRRTLAVDPGDGRPLAHGALAPDRITVDGDGKTVVTGLGTGGGAELAADVRALAAILHECLVGESPASPPRPLAVPGIPPALATVVDRALGVAPGDAPASAAALGAVIEIALPPASREAVAAYAEAILPAEEGDRAALARLLARALAPAVGGALEVSAELIVDDAPAASAVPARQDGAARDSWGRRSRQPRRAPGSGATAATLRLVAASCIRHRLRRADAVISGAEHSRVRPSAPRFAAHGPVRRPVSVGRAIDRRDAVMAEESASSQSGRLRY